MQDKICPICYKKPTKKNPFVRFHITYPPKEMCVLACRYCNYVEYLMRTKKLITGKESQKRIFPVRKYMKKFGIVLGVLFAYSIAISPIFAQTRDSVSTAGGSGTSIDFGVPGHIDTIPIAIGDDSGSPYTIISSTTPYTLLSFTIVSDESVDLYCGTNNLFPSMGLSVLTDFTNQNPYTWSYNGELHCSSDLILNSSTAFQFFGQYVPYDTRVVSSGEENTMSQVHIDILGGMLIFTMFFFGMGFIIFKYIEKK